MCPGRLPADLHRAGVVLNRRGISLSFAICLILGPAIFLAVLAYQGSMADDPSPFDDDPSHHHHQDLPQNAPLRFCAYLDEKSHIQAKVGPCSSDEPGGIYQKHKAAVTKDFCIEELPYGKFDIFNCSDSTISPMESQQQSTDLCPDRNQSGILEAAGCGGNEDSKILERSHITANNPCYTAHPGGWWEPCSKPKDTRQPREMFRSVGGLCIHLGPDGSSTGIKNNTCSVVESGDGAPAKCNECVSVNVEGKKEGFECCLRLDRGVAEVVRCAESSKYTRDNPSNAQEASNRHSSCVVIRPNGTIAVVDCNKHGPVHIGKRNIPPAIEGLCLEVSSDQEVRAGECHKGSNSNALLPHELEPLPPPLLDRVALLADNNSDTLADEPGRWISTNRCTKDFCDWVKIPGEIKNRCYATDDSNPKTPPMPDEALKYTAPYECNVCLESGKHHEDTAHIEQHCRDVITQEELVVKILAGAGGGILLLCLILVIFFEHRRKKNTLKIPNLSFPGSNARSRRRSGRTPVLPPSDGMAELNLSLSSITASQKDAPEIHLVSPPRSLTFQRGVKAPVMPTAQSLKAHVISQSEKLNPIVDVNLSSTPVSAH
jgi:hypothetical protein